MNTTYKIWGLSLLLFLVVSWGAESQQLPQFSQYIFNGLHINPGYAGYKNEAYIQSTYRSQWINFPGAPKTLSVTADFSANEGTMGFGASFLNDQLGPARTTSGLLTYAYRIQTGYDGFLSFGLSAGVSEYAIDHSMLDPVHGGDPHIGEGVVNLFTPNLNAGVFYHTDRFYAGFSTFNMIGKKALEGEDVALAYHDFHYYLTAGVLLDISHAVKMKPSFLVREVKGAPTNFDINAMFLFHERLWLGGSYRSNVRLSDHFQEDLTSRNALAMIIEVFATENLRIGYAYDHNTNALNNYRNNSHEISLGFYLNSRYATLKNPRWF